MCGDFATMMKVERTSYWFAGVAASILAHAAGLSVVAKTNLPRGNDPAYTFAKKVENERVIDVQLAVPEISRLEISRFPGSEPGNPPSEKHHNIWKQINSRPTMVVRVPALPSPVPDVPIAVPSIASSPEALSITPDEPVTNAPSTERKKTESIYAPHTGDPVPQPGSEHSAVPAWQRIDHGYRFSLGHPDNRYPEREYEFKREGNGDLVHRVNEYNSIVIHPDGRMERKNKAFSFGLFGLVIPLDDPGIAYSTWRQVEDATEPLRQQMREKARRENDHRSLNKLSNDLPVIINRHSEWPLARHMTFCLSGGMNV